MTRVRTGLRALAAVLTLMFVGVACGGPKAAVLVTPDVAQGSAVPTGLPSPGGSGGPAVSIDQPLEGATVPAGEVAVMATVERFTLGPGAGASVGHLIFYIDVDFVPTEPGRPAYTAAGTYQTSTTPSVTWPGVAPGKHALFVQLVRADDTPLSPPVTDRAVVTATVPGAPSP